MKGPHDLIRPKRMDDRLINQINGTVIVQLFNIHPLETSGIFVFKKGHENEKRNGFRADFGGNAALIYASFKEQSAIVSKKESKDFNVVFKNWNLLINDTNRKITPTVFTTERNLFLFGNNRGNIVSTSTSGTRINYCKLYDKGALVRDFSPVLAPNGQPALFDQVEKKLYYNKGSGAFLYPDPTN